jgi:hypothetical protein
MGKRWCVATMTAIVLSGVPAAAEAAPIAGDYGGGAIASGFTYAKGGRYTTMALRVDPSRTSVLVTARVGSRCGSSELVRRVPLAGDGSFTVRATSRKRVQFKRFQRKTQKVVIFGRVDGGGGSGNARAKVTYRTHGHIDGVCRVRKQSFQVRAAGPEPAPGPARPSTTYHGLTSQRAGKPRAFVLRVDRRAKRVKTAIFQYTRRCQTGTYSLGNISPGARIRAGGAFSKTERFAIGFSNAVEHFRVRTNGQFTPNGVKGTIKVTSVARARSNGRVIDRCRSGSIGFAASP